MMSDLGFEMSIQQRRAWRAGDLRARCVVSAPTPWEVPAVEAALSAVVARHEILRTSFQCPPGFRVPYQVVNEDARVDVRVLQVADLPDTAARAAAALEAEAALPFEVAAPPLLRACIVEPARDGPGLLVLSLPALCADRATLLRLLHEMQGVPSAEPLQYVDYAQWQADVAAAAAPAARTEGTRMPFAKPQGWGRRWQVAPLGVKADDDTLLAAWWAVLYRSTGVPPVIGRVADGRSQDGFETAMGPFARALPLWVEGDGALPFEALAARLRAAEAEGLRSLETCVPLDLDAGFMVEPTAVFSTPFRLVACEASPEPFAAMLVQGGDGAEIRYDSTRLDARDAESLLEALRAVLAHVAGSPACPLERLPLLSESAARRQRDLLAAAPAHAAAPLMSARFEARAHARPDDLALVSGPDRLTCGALNARANRLAWLLRSRGAGPDVPVAVCLPRSAEAVVAMLAVMKSGGPWVPLDPALPSARLAAMLEDSGARLLVIDGTDELPPGAVRIAPREADAQPEHDPPALAGPADVAYVLFTSGSTGRPKGVAVEHRNLCAYVDAVMERLDVPQGCTWCSVSTLGADLGHTAIFPALCGGVLHLMAQDAVTDAIAFTEASRRHPADVLKIVGSHLSALLDGPRPHDVLPRRCLVLGGEACRWDLVDRVHALDPDLRIVNHYGPTETTVGVLTHEVNGDRDPRWPTVPLGRPLRGARLQVVDAAGSAVGPWMCGELVVGGGGVARGYLQDVRGGFTQVPDSPTVDVEDRGERLYRTGDLVRVLPGGMVAFVGRVDDQVKIRGTRIEPSELSNVLRGCPGVTDAFVLAVREGDETTLTGFIAGRASVEQARSWLQTRVAEAMVPERFTRLDALPLTANGKVDRAALAAMPRGAVQAPFVAPRTPFETTVAGVMAEVLNVPRVGAHDDFFSLGGHSLKATQVVARLCAALGLDVPLRTLFEAPRVDTLAVALQRRVEACSVDSLLDDLESLSDEEVERQLAAGT